MTSLYADLAARLAGIALGHVRQEYPHKLDHVLLEEEDARPPHLLHPIFYGSFDWHSCVHGWWTLLTLRRVFPEMPAAGAIRALADDSFTPAKVQAELNYLARPLSGGFERPYGWPGCWRCISRPAGTRTLRGDVCWHRWRWPLRNG